MKRWTQRTGAQLAAFCSQNRPKRAVLLGQIVMIIEFPYYIYIYMGMGQYLLIPFLVG